MRLWSQKLFVVFLLLLLMCIGSVSAGTYLSQYNSYLVYSSHFNGTQGQTTFTDETGKTITNTGSTTVSTVNPAFGSGTAYFSGSNYLTDGTAANAIPFNGVDNTTVMFWLNASAIGTTSIIGSNPGSSSGVGTSLYGTGSNHIEVFIAQGTSGHAVVAYAIPNAIPNDNNMHQIVIQTDITNSKVSLYLDGAPWGTPQTYAYTPVSTNPTTGFQLGNGGNSGSPLTSGSSIDEFAAWNMGTTTPNIPISTLYPEYGEVGTNVAPIANFTATPLSGAIPIGVQFTDVSLVAPTAWSWTFGDGGTDTSQNPFHTYNAAGIYNVSLNASNLGGSNATTKSNYIRVGTPSVAFTSNSTFSTVGLPVQFTDQSTGSPTIWNWSVGNGQVSALQNPVITYSAAGTYNVNLTASNQYGNNSLVKSNYIVVQAFGTPIAGFTEGMQSGTPGVLVSFTDTSYRGGNTTANYTWSFGDTAGTNPISYVNGSTTHVYAYAGTFVPTLTVANGTLSNTYMGPTITVSTLQNIQNTNVVFSAQQYRFIFQNLVGTPLGGLAVSMTPVNFTMPANWSSQLFGINSQVNLQTGGISGITGSDGSFGAPMFTSLDYRVNVSGIAASGDSVSISFIEYPPSSGMDIVVSLPTSKTPSISLVPTISNISYNVYNQSISNTTQILSVNYYDPTGLTNYTQVTVVNQSGHILNQTNYTGSAADNIVNNYTYTLGVSSPPGDILSFGFSAYNPNAGGWNNISQPLAFNTGTSLMGGSIPTAYDGWLAIILIVFISAAFTASSIYIGVIGCGLMGEFFYHITQWFTPAIGGIAFDAMCIFWIVIGVIGFITKKSRTVF